MPATLRFIESGPDYSTYERPDGTEVYIAHGFPRVYLVEFSTDWAFDQWRRSPLTGGAFLDWLRENVTDPTDVDDCLIICEDCGGATDRDESWTVGRSQDTVVCESCMEDYYTCADCSSLVPDNEIHSTLHDEPVCDYCRARNYTWCDDCDGYYHDSYADEHAHNDECDCESPQMSFRIRNDGNGMLQNDERATVSLPAGTLDDEGVSAIWRYLKDQGQDDAKAVLVSGDIGRQWQTKDGNLTKRLGRATYKTYGTKIPPEVLSQVGCIARDHSKSVDFTVAATRELNMSAAAFYHEDSCWWQSYSEGRCTLKSNGGFGLRSFDSDGDVSGRAWVMPLKRLADSGALVPTFNTETPDAFVVFNCYGQLEGYSAARIVAHMAGMTYRKVTFSCSPMFINSDVGYLIASEDIADEYTDGDLTLWADQHSSRFYSESRDYARETVNV